MPMPANNLDLFINYCDSFANVYINLISDPFAHKHMNLPTTIMDFLSDCRSFFELEEYRIRREQSPFMLLKNLYEKIDAFQMDDKKSYKLFETYELPNDPEWNEVQKLAKKTQEILNLFLKEVHT